MQIPKKEQKQKELGFFVLFCILLSPANFYIKLPATRFDNTLSTRICGRIKCYREGESAIKTISPLQLAIQVVHKRLAGEQGTHCNGGSSLHLRGGGGRSQKNFFRPLVCSKNKCSGGPPLDPLLHWDKTNNENYHFK